MTERLQPQDVTKMINFYGDFLCILNGKAKIYMQDIRDVKADSQLIGMELREGDYLDPYCALDHFPTERLRSINRRVKDNRVVKMTIQHSAWAKESSRFFYIPTHVYHLYVKDKNYLSIFSKEDIEQYLYHSLPKCVDLVSEKKKLQIKETLKFKILHPNTVLADESRNDLPVCYAVIAGDLRVFKKDPTCHAEAEHHDHDEKEHGKAHRHPPKVKSSKLEKIKDKVARGEYGRLVTLLNFDDMLTEDSKVFVGFDPAWQAKE